MHLSELGCIVHLCTTQIYVARISFRKKQSPQALRCTSHLCTVHRRAVLRARATADRAQAASLWAKASV